MTRMAEEYHDRTKDFSGAIRQKFPFYLFREAQDYFDAGGLPGSAGVFMVRGDEAKLMAIAGEKSTNGTWLDGKRCRRGVEEIVPNKAEIGVAEVLTLSFEVRG